MTDKEASRRPGPLGPRAFVANGEEFHRAVRNDDAEGGADGALDELNMAVMGADQFGGDREPEPAAAGPAAALERLEQMVARLLRHARTGIGHFEDRDRPLASTTDANLRRAVAAGIAFQRLRGVAHQVEQ